MEASKFEYAATCSGDIVDFQIVRGPPDAISQDKISFVSFGRQINYDIVFTEFILCDPKLAFANPEMDKYLSSNVYQAKGERFKDSLPQAAMAAASYVRLNTSKYL